MTKLIETDDGSEKATAFHVSNGARGDDGTVLCGIRKRDPTVVQGEFIGDGEDVDFDTHRADSDGSEDEQNDVEVIDEDLRGDNSRVDTVSKSQKK